MTHRKNQICLHFGRTHAPELLSHRLLHVTSTYPVTTPLAVPNQPHMCKVLRAIHFPLAQGTVRFNVIDTKYHCHFFSYIHGIRISSAFIICVHGGPCTTLQICPSFQSTFNYTDLVSRSDALCSHGLAHSYLLLGPSLFASYERTSMMVAELRLKEGMSNGFA